MARRQMAMYLQNVHSLYFSCLHLEIDAQAAKTTREYLCCIRPTPHAERLLVRRKCLSIYLLFTPGRSATYNVNTVLQRQQRTNKGQPTTTHLFFQKYKQPLNDQQEVVEL